MKITMPGIKNKKEEKKRMPGKLPIIEASAKCEHCGTTYTLKGLQERRIPFSRKPSPGSVIGGNRCWICDNMFLKYLIE